MPQILIFILKQSQFPRPIALQWQTQFLLKMRSYIEKYDSSRMNNFQKEQKQFQFLNFVNLAENWAMFY